MTLRLQEGDFDRIAADVVAGEGAIISEVLKNLRPDDPIRVRIAAIVADPLRLARIKAMQVRQPSPSRRQARALSRERSK